jgi:hypothetical protein
MRLSLTWIFLILTTFHNSIIWAQEYRIDRIKNCQGELRIVTFNNQVRFFKQWIEGRSDIHRQAILQFAPSYKVDTAALDEQIVKVRKMLPIDFFKMKLKDGVMQGPAGNWVDNTPDEKAIWFEDVFSMKDKTGKVIVYAAVRVTFDGHDARIDEERMSPKITNVQFIFDRQELKKISQQAGKLFYN